MAFNTSTIQPPAPSWQSSYPNSGMQLYPVQYFGPLPMPSTTISQTVPAAHNPVQYYMGPTYTSNMIPTLGIPIMPSVPTMIPPPHTQNGVFNPPAVQNVSMSNIMPTTFSMDVPAGNMGPSLQSANMMPEVHGANVVPATHDVVNSRSNMVPLTTRYASSSLPPMTQPTFLENIMFASNEVQMSIPNGVVSSTENMVQTSDHGHDAPTETNDISMMEDPVLEPKVQNVVCTFNVGCQLDLNHIALHAKNCEYNPKRFAAVIMRIREPKTTALIFKTGRMVCTGAKSEDFAKLAARRYVRIMEKMGFPVKFEDFKIQNIVGSCDVKFPISLVRLQVCHAKFATYEAEIFPGLVYRMKKPDIVLIVFTSGKVILTGAKVKDELREAFDNIYPILLECKKVIN